MCHPLYRSARPLVVALGLALGWAPLVSAAVLEVGPGKTYALPSQAATAAQAGDTIQISAGLYTGDVCFWQADNLTIRGVGGFAHLEANGASAGGKAIWVVQGANTTIESIEFSGAAVSDLNGAGIRLEGAGLTVRSCWFHDNQDGILAGDNAASDVLIERSEFDHNGAGDGYSHNLYINHVRSFTFRYCYSHRAVAGHEFKSRALSTYVYCNRIMDEDGTASYTIDVPNGGLTCITGNLIQQGPNSANGGIISVAEEGATNPTQHLYVINNTIVNDRSGGTFLTIASGTTVARVENNILLGSGTAISGTATSNLHNLITTTDPLLVNRAGYDYHLQAGSPAIDAGADPGSADSIALLPARQYVHPLLDEARVTAGAAVDVGAYEYAAVAPAPGITVSGNGITIAAGDATPASADGSDFGDQQLAAGSVSRTFSISDSGSAALTLGTVTVSGANASDFTVSTQPASSVTAGASTVFQVSFAPSALGARTASINVADNVAGKNPYTFAVRGNGVAPGGVAPTPPAGSSSGSGSHHRCGLGGAAAAFAALLALLLVGGRPYSRR